MQEMLQINKWSVSYFTLNIDSALAVNASDLERLSAVTFESKL